MVLLGKCNDNEEYPNTSQRKPLKIKMSVPVPKFSHLYLDSKGGNGSWTSSVLENIIWKTLKTIKLRGTRPVRNYQTCFHFLISDQIPHCPWTL